MIECVKEHKKYNALLVQAVWGQARYLATTLHFANVQISRCILA